MDANDDIYVKGSHLNTYSFWTNMLVCIGPTVNFILLEFIIQPISTCNPRRLCDSSSATCIKFWRFDQGSFSTPIKPVFSKIDAPVVAFILLQWESATLSVLPTWRYSGNGKVWMLCCLLLERSLSHRDWNAENVVRTKNSPNSNKVLHWRVR